MINFSDLSSIVVSIIRILIVLIIAIIILLRVSFNMIEKRRIKVFMPFFILGLSLCFVSGFMFYGFFGIAIYFFLVAKFLASFAIFFIIWRYAK